MRHRLLVAAGLAATLVGLAGCGGSGEDNGSSASGQGKTLTVWLMPEAQQGWPGAIKVAEEAVEKKFPGVTVKVEQQTWPDHQTKLDAALAGNTPPDVVELGNTEVAKYADAGALLELTASEFENSDTWLQGLTDSCTLDGKLYCVPYYAGARVVAYNKDLFARAGITAPPKSWDELTQAADKLMAKFGSDKQFSAFFMPGQYWYAAMTFVHDYGGKIAEKQGDTWQGRLGSPESVRGLTAWQQLVHKYSRADKNGNEQNQYQVFAKGKVGMMLALGWEVASVADPKTGNPAMKDKVGLFALPSHEPGKNAPSFLGGSDLAIVAKSKNHQIATEWVKAFTGARAQTEIATKGKQIPNSTKLLDLLRNDPATAPFAAAAERNWFVPTTPGWAAVENKNLLQNALVEIANGKPVQQVAQQLDQQITQTLNEES